MGAGLTQLDPVSHFLAHLQPYGSATRKQDSAPETERAGVGGVLSAQGVDDSRPAGCV